MYPEISLDELYLQPRLLHFAVSAETSEICYVAFTNDLFSLCLMPATPVYPKVIYQSRNPLGVPKWSPKGDAIAWSDCGVNLWSMKKSLHFQVTREPEHRFLNWAPNGKSLLFADKGEHQEDLWIATIDGGLRNRIQQVKGNIIDASWSPNGQQVLFVTELEQSNKITVEIINIESEETFLLWEEGFPLYAKTACAWFPDGKKILITNNESGFCKLWVLDLENRQQMAITQGDYDDLCPLISRDGSQIAWTCSKPGTGERMLQVQQLGSDQPPVVVKDCGVNIPVAWQKEDAALFFTHEEAQETVNLWKIDVQSGAQTRLTSAGHLGLEKKLYPPRCHYLNQDTRSLYCQLYCPADFQESCRYPLVIWLQDSPTTPNHNGHFPRYHWLANQGYLVAVLSCHGNGSGGSKFMKEGLKNGLAIAALEDIRNAVEIFEKSVYMHAGKIAIGGCSWGGYLALMAICSYPEMFRCAFAHGAISDWEIQLSQTSQSKYFQQICGRSYAEDPVFFRNISPCRLIKDLQTPLLLTHGCKDRVVPFAQAQKLAETAASLRLPVHTHFYADEGDDWRQREQLYDWHERVSSFLRHNLPPARQV